jgi:two-component system NtrC family sensor kinase
MIDRRGRFGVGVESDSVVALDTGFRSMTHDELTDALSRLADLGHLSGGVGHHVINAFSTIVSNAEILRLTANSRTAVDPLTVADIMVREAVEASAVARRLIDYTRSATAVGTDRVALDVLMDYVVGVERDQGHPGIAWVTDLAPVPKIIGNDLQLHAMTRHLIANAYESMRPEGGTITVSTGLDARGWVVLEIRDTGQGMDSEAQERAVEPFFTTKPGHFGVGLSIANGIWRRHRGTLALNSQPGDGTTVRLCVEPAPGEPFTASAHVAS